jgi:Ca2+-binding RTX toxin-like protein
VVEEWTRRARLPQEWGSHQAELNRDVKDELETMKRTFIPLVVMVAVMLLVAGTALAQTVNCSGGECRGTDTADRIFGSISRDIVYAKGGNDRVFGRGGDDVLKGDQGNDEVRGQSGPDRVKGGLGSDSVFGGRGDDVVRGGTHHEADDGARDVLDCGEGEDTVYYTPGVDELRDCEILNPPL